LGETVVSLTTSIAEYIRCKKSLK